MDTMDVIGLWDKLLLVVTVGRGLSMQHL